MALDISKLVSTLKTKREEQGLSLRKLSAKIGVSFSTLARIERGDGEPDNNSALRIIEWLGKDGEDVGLSFDNVALVHFRAAKNASSKTIECLLDAANVLKKRHKTTYEDAPSPNSEVDSNPEDLDRALALSKPEMEEMAISFRADLGIENDKPLPALSVSISGVQVLTPDQIEGIKSKVFTHLIDTGSDEWSAMSVPLNIEASEWAILRNNTHTVQRQRVTYLEECWHILLGHKLTKVARIAGAYGRTYESSEEHDAYYLASACLLPEDQVSQMIKEGESPAEIGEHFGTSPELVEYRTKRLGLWRIYKGLQIGISDD